MGQKLGLASRERSSAIQAHIGILYLFDFRHPPDSECAWSAPNDERRGWIFSGFDLIEASEGRPAEWATGIEHDRAFSNASAYISGAADATIGMRWCGVGTVMPHKLVDRAYNYLSSLHSDRRQENA